MSKPKHHVRGTVCASRPPYREGRKSKAVKVYTVNQESQYLLIQGIPAVGTTKDLVDLFASHGEIAEHRMLDDYPSEQFTDVCLIKFQRIQSARLAKRRLDDWSFYGGVLHVCYAPEYETVQETREKLQDRRKVIAAKVRQYSRDGTYEENYQQKPSTDEKPVISSVILAGSQYNAVTATTTGTQYNSVTVATGTSIQTGSQIVHSTNSVSHMNANSSYISVNQTTHSLTGTEPCSSHTNKRPSVEQIMYNQSAKYSEEEEQLWLPPPPKQTKFSHISEQKQGKIRSGLGPSAQATFPPDFDARTDQPSGVSLTEYISRGGPNTAAKQTEKDQEENTIKSVQQKIEENLKSTSVVIKQAPQKPSVPRFIPRQTQAKFKPKPFKVTRIVPSVSAAASSVETDMVNMDLKKNAFTLGKQQGAVDLEEHTRVRPGKEEVSIQQSVKQIRNKLSQVTKDSSENPTKDR